MPHKQLQGNFKVTRGGGKGSSKNSAMHTRSARPSFVGFEKSTLKVSGFSEKLKTLETSTLCMRLAGTRSSGSSHFNHSNIVDQEQKDRQGVNETAPLLQ